MRSMQTAEVDELGGPALEPTQIWNGDKRPWQQSYRLKIKTWSTTEAGSRYPGALPLPGI